MNTDSGAISITTGVGRVRVHAGLTTLLLLSAAHFFIDLYSGALSVMQPLLVEKLNLSLTQAGLLGGLLVFSSSVTQPLYGYWSDVTRSRLFTALAPAVAGLFIAALGFAPSFTWALMLVFAGGAGISSFHPQGSAWATAGMARNKARWMAFFISSGTLGIALSPSAFSLWIERFGFEQAIWAALPGIVMSVLLLTVMPVPERATAHSGKTFDLAPLKAVWQPLLILFLGVFIRSIVQVTYTQFLALYLHRERGFPLQHAALVLTVYLTMGAIGGFVGGHLSDRFGARRVMMVSFLLSVPFMAVFFFVTQSWLGVLSLAVGGFVLYFTIPVNVTVAQQLVPSQAGTVSALMMGFAWGTAGMIFIPLTGWISDHSSLHSALSVLLSFPVLGYLVTRKLPKEIG